MKLLAATLVVVVLATMVRAQQQVAFEALAPADYTVHSQPESLLTANEGVVRAKRQFGYGGYGGGFRGGYGRGFGGGYGRGFGGGYGGGYGGYGGGFGGYGR